MRNCAILLVFALAFLPARSIKAQASAPDAGALPTARALMDSGQHSAAMTEIIRLRTAWPRVYDRLAMLEGSLWLKLGDFRRASKAFEAAMQSPQSDVRAQAKVEWVRTLIRAASPRAEAELRLLQRSYPALPQAPELQLELADAKAKAGHSGAAVALYQRLDVQHPATANAAQARLRLQQLQARGVRVAPPSVAEQLTRAERLLRTAPPAEARAAIEALQRQTRLSAAQLAALRRMADVLQARAGAQPAAASPAAEVRSEAELQARWQRLLRRRSLARLTTSQLLQALQLAAPAGWTERSNEVLTMLVRQQPSARSRLRAAILGAGVADDALLVQLLEPVAVEERAGEALRYHYARALERAGQPLQALEVYRSLLDQAATASGDRYYALWAFQRTAALHAAAPAVASPAEDTSLHVAPAAYVQPVQPAAANKLRADLDLSALRQRLEPVVAAYGDAYPWLGRCVDLLQLGEEDAAADELRELYLAWRQANGRPYTQFGLEAVFRGVSRKRHAVSFKLRRQRRTLDEASLAVLSDAAEQLGDAGTALGLGSKERLDRHPHAYADAVERAAARFAIDADLLFAVMRVESVYQRSIVSYAGAVGLMQIMPGTGRRIAYHLGDYDFTTDALLDPNVNIEFGAWYLASLLQRFQGRLPLAIAAYNGGPHNVRKWLRDSAPQMPLDAFLEEIPFSQTHRYVRRVLTAYAVYRAKSGRSMQTLDITLPQPQADAVAF